MSGITLSSSVRQNLLSLQSTAQLLSETQNQLATGKKVSSAIDNPTSFFTAASLDNRAADINNLLDGIGNGVQVLQSANRGITSLQSLVDSAKSIASQVLQTTIGYSTKSTVSSGTLAGASANDLLGASSAPVSGSAVLNDNTTTAVAITGATKLSGTAGTSSNNLATAVTTSDTLTINGKTFTFVAGSSSTGTTIGVGDTVTNLLSAIQNQTGVTGSISNGAITLNGGAAGVTISGSSNALTALGLSATGNGLAGQTLTVAATGGGTATNITFGQGTGQVQTLTQLNAALSANNLQATFANGKLSISTTNDAASSTIGTLGGTSVSTSGAAFYGATVAGPIADANAQQQRSALVAQYNNVLKQIDATARDASYNGVNLLNGDTLKLTFNETGTSKLDVTGTSMSAAGLGLATLTANTDFIDAASANKVLKSLDNAASSLRTQASTLGSNLSIVQTRSDFNKSLIELLHTGSANLTMVDTNEAAAISQSLSARQSIAVSALSLANQSQMSVLQLLR